MSTKAGENKNAALDRLLRRTLADPGRSSGVKKQTRSQRNMKKLAQQKKQETKALTDEKERQRQLKKKVAKNVAALESWEDEGLLDLKRQVNEKRAAASKVVTNAKRAKGEPKSWPGLTPGLAPVDYEESSDSEDE
jgi:cell wall-associated NlpC family hydrolase